MSKRLSIHWILSTKCTGGCDEKNILTEENSETFYFILYILIFFFKKAETFRVTPLTQKDLEPQDLENQS